MIWRNRTITKPAVGRTTPRLAQVPPGMRYADAERAQGLAEADAIKAFATEGFSPTALGALALALGVWGVVPADPPAPTTSSAARNEVSAADDPPWTRARRRWPAEIAWFVSGSCP